MTDHRSHDHHDHEGHQHEAPAKTATTAHAELAWTISHHDEATILSGCVTPLQDESVTAGMMANFLQACSTEVQRQNGLVGHFKSNFETTRESCTISITSADATPALTGSCKMDDPLIDEGFFTLIALLMDSDELERIFADAAQTTL